MRTFLVLFLVMGLVPAIAQIPTDGLVAHYPFNGNANDATGNGNNGVVRGAVLTQDRFGFSNQAYHFNGTGAFVEVPHSPSLSLVNGVTISAWVKLDPDVVEVAKSILTKGVDNPQVYTGDWFMMLWNTDGSGMRNRPHAWVSNSLQYFDGNGVLAPNTWYHVAMTYGGSTIKSYINGIFDGSKAATGLLRVTNSTLRIGVYEPSGAPGWFPGSIDDIRIYNRAVSSSEIRSLYNEGMVLVEGGTFQMGSTSGDSDEQPVHAVTLSSFYLDTREVTVGQYRAFCSATGRSMPAPPSWGWSEDNPMVYVSWNDASAYAQWIGKRLPTEAEWEYAARGGNRSQGYLYSGSNSIGDVAWYSSNSGNRTHPVGSKIANELGLYDMSGNVWDWCSDWYGSGYYSVSPSLDPKGPSNGSFRVLRGGSWLNLAFNSRVAERLGNASTNVSFYDVGFRCAMDYVEAPVEMGSLLINLYDAEAWGQPGTTGRVVLFNGGGQVAQAQANSSSVVTFSNITAGTGYYYRVYANKPSPWGEQFWGEKTGISIVSNNTTYDTFTRNAPYCPAINVYNDMTGEDVYQKTVPLGTRLRIQHTIKNPSYVGAMPVNAYGGIILDRDKTPPYDLNSQTSSETFAVGTTKQIVSYFTPGTNGSYYHSGSAFGSSTTYSTSLTDAGNWGTIPFFTVGTDNTAPPAPISLASTPGGWTNVNSFSINWTNPSDASGIAAAWYKLGSAPGSSTDGTRQMGKPFAVAASGEGGQVLYLWLEDGGGNKDQNNRSATTLYYDGTAPTGGTIAINSGAASTSSLIVTLNGLGATDGGGSGLPQMRFSNNNASWSPWESYTGTRSGWDLTQYGGNAALGQKLVYAQYRDGAGNVSSVVFDDITYQGSVTDFWVYTNGPGIGNDVRSFAVDSKGRLLAGTWSSGGTVWRTSDNGVSWVQLGTIPISDPVMGISVNAQDHIFISVITKGFYRSTDEGASWQLKNNGLTNLRVRGNLVDKKGYVWVGSEGGLFRSTNNGDSWVSMFGGSYGGLFLDSANAIVVGDGSYIYRSTNDGVSWTSTPASSGLGPGGIHPDGSYFSWTANSAIYRSTDFGVSWTNLNNPYSYTGYTAAMTFNARGDIFYAKDGDNAGVVMSTNMGATWTAVNAGLATTRVIPLIYHPNGHVFVGTNGYGVFRTRVATQPVPDDTVPPWKFANTGASHTIIIPLSANPNINGTPLVAGDYVGVFHDSSGTVACAGYERWTGTSNITVSAFGDDLTTGAKDGLAGGEVFRWKVFRESELKVYEAEATYAPVGGVVTNTNSYVTNGISQLTSLVGGVTTHGVALRSGWGLISSYVTPPNSALDVIFQPVVTDVIIVKNGAQKTYIPSVPVNTIGPWEKTEGYQIKMANARTLSLTGQKIVPWSLTIGLPQGWSIMPYVRDSEMSIATALSGVVGDIVIVKDQDGKTYIPSVGINSIGTLRVGQAYQIKMTASRTIEYPATSGAIESVESASSTNTTHKTTATPPWFYSNTGVSHTVIIPSSMNPSVDGTPLVAGDYIGVFYDSSGTQACAGYETWTGTTSLAVAAFGDDGTTPAKDGLAAGEVLRWKIWRQSDSHVFTGIATYVTPGGMGGIVTDTSRYTTNGISAMATFTGSVTSVALMDAPSKYVLMQNYPNPFNPSTTITFGLPQRTRVRVTVYNTLGEEVAELLNGERESGYHEVRFDALGLSSGVYLYRIQAGDFTFTRKLLLVR